MSKLDAALLVGAGLGLVGCLVFVLAYAIRTRGASFDSEIGWFLIVVYANLGALYGLILINHLVGDWPGRAQAGLILFCAYVIETWWPLRLLVRNQGGSGRRGASMNVARVRKAIVAGVGAGIGAAVAALVNAAPPINSDDIAVIVGAFVTAALGVGWATYQVRNGGGTINGSDPLPPASQDERRG